MLLNLFSITRNCFFNYFLLLNFQAILNSARIETKTIGLRAIKTAKN